MATSTTRNAPGASDFTAPPVVRPSVLGLALVVLIRLSGTVVPEGICG
jgi:hypothetical protein